MGLLKKTLRELVKVGDERKIIDVAGFYKKRSDVLFELNESRIQSPVILVDPTWKERNALAGLSRETFDRFQDVARKFLKNPSKKFFELEKFDASRLKGLARKKKGELVHVVLETNRQEGDIAGTKMKKFSRFLTNEMSKYFDVFEAKFVYTGAGKKSDLYLIARAKKEIVRRGPPVKMKKAAKAFRAKNKNVFVKNNVLYVREKIGFSAGEFFKSYKKKEKGRIKEMGIVGMDVKG